MEIDHGVANIAASWSRTFASGCVLSMTRQRCGSAGGARKIGRANALEEFRLLPLELVQRAPVGKPLPPDPDRNIENKRQVRPKIIERDAAPCRRSASPRRHGRRPDKRRSRR